MEAYLDNAATTKCLKEAADRMVEVLTLDYGNPSSMHKKGITAEQYVTEAKKKIAKTLKAQEKEIIFTSGGTESNNLAILGATAANHRAGKHVITTAIEHASVAQPFAWLEENGFEVTYLPVNEYGEISPEELKNAIRGDTILVSLMHVNNEIGAIEPIAEAGQVIKMYNPAALFHVDAIQSYGKIPVVPKKMNVDLLSVSGHKIHGPKGSGFLYVKDKTKIKPQILGGGQQKGMRSGTENVPAIAGLAAAAEFMEQNLAQHTAHLYGLRAFFLRQLEGMEGVSVNGRQDESAAPHIVSVSVDGVRAEVLLHTLEEREIYVSAGSACSSNKPAVSRTLKSIGLRDSLLDSTVRFSFSRETTQAQLEYTIDVMREVIPRLQKYTRH